MGPLVSIVTPSYNQAPFLRQTIESVLSQDYQPIEYFVLDGGSTDGSVAIIREYQDSLAGWSSAKDGGQAAAIAQGWRQSHGEIVAWLNSDDYYASGAISEVVEVFQRRPEVGVVTGDCVVVDAAGRFVRRMPSSPGGFSEAHLSGNSLPQPGVFCRRSSVEAVGSVNPNFRYVMDWDLWLRLWRAGAKFAYLPCTLAHFRVWPQSKTMSSKLGFAQERLTVYESLLRDARNTGHPDCVQAASSLQLSCLLEHAFLCQLSGSPADAETYFDQATAAAPGTLQTLPHSEALALQLAEAPGGIERSAANFIDALAMACSRRGLPANPGRWKGQLLSAARLVEAWEASYSGAQAYSASCFMHAIAADPRLLFRRGVVSPALKAALRACVQGATPNFNKSGGGTRRGSL